MELNGSGFKDLLPEGMRFSEREGESEVTRTETSAKEWER